MKIIVSDPINLLTILADFPRLDRQIEAVQEGNCAASIVYVENPVLVWVFSVCSVARVFSRQSVD
jgi:hypothetical protein